VILVDTTIWVDHFRSGDPGLEALLDNVRILGHPHVIGELALGGLRRRQMILNALQRLPQAIGATNSEVLHFVESNGLMGLGIGWIDAHLLASARLSSAALWTRDPRLQKAASSLGLAYAPE
jgi:predicted nucleic acid-binding protein